MKKLFYKDKQAIGLDISQTGIKVMAVDSRKWIVQGYGSVDLDPDEIQTSLDSDDQTYLEESVKSLLSEHLVGALPSNHVVIGLPTQRSFSRTFTLPAKEEKHLASAVELEVEQYIPIPISLLYVSYEIIERTDKQIRVIMSAIPRQLVDVAVTVAQNAGLRPVMVEPSINAVARVLEATEEAKLTTLIIDIGQANTDIAVLENGAIRISGGLDIGGNTFTLTIAKKLGVTLDNAHQMKVLHGLDAGQHQAKLQRALDESLQKIAGEVRKIIRYYTERIDSEHKIEQVLIVGAGSNVPGIGDYFTNDLIMPARVAAPWQKLDFGSLPQPNKQFRPRYITVAGLASVNYERLWK